MKKQLKEIQERPLFDFTMSDNAVPESIVAPMIKGTQDMMFESGYDSDGEPPFLVT